LCKKKAHIRVQRKQTVLIEDTAKPLDSKAVAEEKTPEKASPAPAVGSEPKQKQPPVSVAEQPVAEKTPQQDQDEQEEPEEQGEIEPQANGEDEEVGGHLAPPSEEGLAAIRADLHQLLNLMGLPSAVDVRFEENTVHCHITGQYVEQIIGAEGRTLDSLQYLLRKMVSAHLPDRIMLALNAGDFRERRAEELKVRAVELAEKVKADGKTQSIPALNPSERRVVHMILQEDKGVRSRSVGEGLFKKVLIYKPGKGRRPAAKKRRGGQGGRPSGD